MKILLIHTEEEKTLAMELKPLLEETGARTDTFPISSTEGAGKTTERELITLLSPSAPENDTAVTHAVVLSALDYRWIYFLTGFSCASHVPFLVYGEDAIKCIPEEFSFGFKFFNAEPELKKYIEAEYVSYMKKDADRGAMAARETLLKMGVPVNEKALAYCVEEGRSLEVLFFLAAGFSPNTKSPTGVPLMSLAARKGNREIVRFLYSAGADVNLQADDRGTSALVDSAMGKHYDLLTDLIKVGADVNVQSKDGQTALVVAVGAGDDRLVEALLKAGANPDIKDSMGVSARKYAALFHKSSITSLFATYAPPPATG